MKSVRFQQESPSAFIKGGCPFSARIHVRLRQELLSGFCRNCCPLSARMSVRFAQEYADKSKLMKMINDEEGWDYTNENLAEKYKVALETSIIYVAYQEDLDILVL